MGTNSTEYSKAYRLKRKQADPNFLEKERAYGAKRYKTDAEYRAYMNKKNKAYRQGQLDMAKAIYKNKDGEICKHCGLPTKIGANNPICDHLYYPENCNICNKHK